MDAKASIHPQKEDTDLNREDIFKTANPDSHMKLHIDYGDEEDFSSIDSTLTDYLYVIGEVEDMVQQAMHANIDSIKPIDFKTYNKLLTSELEARNIVTEHELVTIYKPNILCPLYGTVNNASGQAGTIHYVEKPRAFRLPAP